MLEQQALSPQSEVGDGDWVLIDLTKELTNRATLVANQMDLPFEQLMKIALEEKLERMGLRSWSWTDCELVIGSA